MKCLLHIKFHFMCNYKSFIFSLFEIAVDLNSDIRNDEKKRKKSEQLWIHLWCWDSNPRSKETWWGDFSNLLVYDGINKLLPNPPKISEINTNHHQFDSFSEPQYRPINYLNKKKIKIIHLVFIFTVHTIFQFKIH